MQSRRQKKGSRQSFLPILEFHIWISLWISIHHSAQSNISKVTRNQMDYHNCLKSQCITNWHLKNQQEVPANSNPYNRVFHTRAGLVCLDVSAQHGRDLHFHYKKGYLHRYSLHTELLPPRTASRLPGARSNRVKTKNLQSTDRQRVCQRLTTLPLWRSTQWQKDTNNTNQLQQTSRIIKDQNPPEPDKLKKVFS